MTQNDRAPQERRQYRVLEGDRESILPAVSANSALCRHLLDHHNGTVGWRPEVSDPQQGEYSLTNGAEALVELIQEARTI